MHLIAVSLVWPGSPPIPHPYRYSIKAFNNNQHFAPVTYIAMIIFQHLSLINTLQYIEAYTNTAPLTSILSMHSLVDFGLLHENDHIALIDTQRADT